MGTNIKARKTYANLCNPPPAIGIRSSFPVMTPGQSKGAHQKKVEVKPKTEMGSGLKQKKNVTFN